MKTRGMIAIALLVASSAFAADYWMELKHCDGCSVELKPIKSPSTTPTASGTATGTPVPTRTPTATATATPPQGQVVTLIAPQSTLVQCVQQVGGNNNRLPMTPGSSATFGCGTTGNTIDLTPQTTIMADCGGATSNSSWTQLAAGETLQVLCTGNSTPTPGPSNSSTPQPSATATPPSLAGLDILSGTYQGCDAGQGAGCAKGDAVSGSDGTVSTNSWVLQSSANQFTNGMAGKRISLMQWGAPNSTAGCWSGYACYTGVACEGTVASVQSSSQLTVSKTAGCGSSGIGFNASAGAFWIVGNDDSAAIGNALNQAKTNGQNLVFPANYNGLVFTAVTPPSNSAIQCAAGATLWNPHMTTGQTQIFRVTNSGFKIDSCTMSGTEQPGNPFYSVLREYDLAISIFTGKGSSIRTDITHNTFKNFWGTYTVGTSNATGAVINDNFFGNCAYYGIQENQAGGTNPTTQVERNRFEDCNYGSEDGNPMPSGGNSQQEILNNTFRLVNSNGCGTGYNCTQKSVSGLGSHGALFVDTGMFASGGTPTSGQYSGVVVQGNDMQGAGINFMAGTNCSSNPYGAIVSDNICSNGCQCTN